jgi:hypothetical protein
MIAQLATCFWGLLQGTQALAQLPAAAGLRVTHSEPTAQRAQQGHLCWYAGFRGSGLAVIPQRGQREAAHAVRHNAAVKSLLLLVHRQRA